MHILLIRFSSMGDVVLTTATLNWLHSLFGDELSITFATSKEFEGLVQGHPSIKNVVTFDRKNGEKWNDLVQKIKIFHKARPIDLMIDLHGTLRSLRLRFSFWRIPALTVDKRRWERFFLTNVKSVWFKKFISEKLFGLEPQVVRVLKDFEALFGDDRAVRSTRELRGGRHDELTSLKLIDMPPVEKPYVVLAPSASFRFKRWPVESFVDLARTLLQKTNLDVVILAGKDDQFCQAFDQLQDSRLHNLQGKTSLSESMGYLRGAKISIGNDSGMNHIAEAYGVPCVTIFGPTDPRFGFAPHGNASVALSKDLWCKPCSTTGKKDCFRDKHYCMELITVDEVLAATLATLERRP